MPGFAAVVVPGFLAAAVAGFFVAVLVAGFLAATGALGFCCEKTRNGVSNNIIRNCLMNVR